MPFATLNGNINKHFNIYAFVILLVYSFIIRYPFFSIYKVDWDEWTFILMGQDILNGHLLYSNLWDLKPPLAFSAFAVFISIFGKNIEGIRISGTIFVAFSSFFVFLISRKLLSCSFSLLAGILFILLVSLPVYQATLTEHLALLPLLVALWLMLSKPRNATRLYLIGVFLTIAIFIRLNLSFVALFLGIYLILSKAMHRDTMGGLKDGAMLSLGFVSIFTCTLVPYIINDQINLYIQSVFFAPLDYANAKLSLIDAFLSQINKMARMFCLEYELLFGLSYIVAILGLSFLLTSRHPPEKKDFILIFLLFATAVEFSILQSGRTFNHYMIQLSPFLSILCVYAIWRASRKFSLLLRYLSLPIIISLLAFFVALSFYHAEKKQKNNIQRVKLIQYLKSEVSSQDNLLITDEHIIYWLLDKEPIRPSLTHPSNIMKPFLLKHIPGAEATTYSELEVVMRQRPEYIITNEKLLPILEGAESFQIFASIILCEYTLRKKIGNALVYKKIE